MCKRVMGRMRRRRWLTRSWIGSTRH
jgi:hypothetical protein